MKMILTVATIVTLISGCSEKTVYVRNPPYDFQKIEQPKERTIRVHKDDEKLYRAYITRFRSIIDFYNDQIDDYKRSHDKNSTGVR